VKKERPYNPLDKRSLGANVKDFSVNGWTDGTSPQSPGMLSSRGL